MLPFWLWPYPGRLLSALLLLLITYTLFPDVLASASLLILAVLAYVAGHWVWYLWRKMKGKVVAFDVGGVIVEGDYFTEKIRPMPGMYEFVTNVRKNYVTAVLSNNNRMADYGFRKWFKADDLFDIVYYSSDLGAKKPDEASFLRFCKKMGVSPHNVVFFDDQEPNVIAAKKAGLNAHVFKNVSQAEEIIRKI